MSSLPSVGILGAGCIGSYLAGALLPAYKSEPNKLSIFVRDRQLANIAQHGLKVTDYNGFESNTAENISALTTNNTTLTELSLDVLLVTVKCTAVSSSVDDIKQVVSPNTIIVALQNGIGSENAIKDALPNHTVITGIVGFNVTEEAPGHFHRGTEGEVIIEAHEREDLATLVRLFNQHHVPAELRSNFEQVRWGKLLLNLNNAVNALADVPLKKQLSDRGYRRVLANLMQETLTILKHARIKPAKLTKVSPNIVPLILKSPNWLFTRIANQMLAIDPLARSSMWYDVSNNKMTEVDYINGAVVTLAKELGLEAPLNAHIVDTIKEVEKLNQGSPGLLPAELTPSSA
ncbi:2-dehydropantoate 2-reductase [Thalassotalea euphylliae]|uniref:2-dehydropantoate 2-reductase n=1 Tax=Thalassotalea euphylliae TaxID=1655234 RepID=UPI00362C17A0